MLNSHLCSFPCNIKVKQYDYDIYKSRCYKNKNLKISKSQSGKSGKCIPCGLPLISYLGMSLYLCPVDLIQPWFLEFFVDEEREWSHPNTSGRGPSTTEWEYSASRQMTMNHWKTWPIGVHTHFIPLWSCYCDPVLSVSAVMVVMQSTVQWQVWVERSIAPPNACDPVGHSVNEDIHAHYTLPGIFTHPQWMLQLTFMGEVIASHWSTPRKSS